MQLRQRTVNRARTILEKRGAFEDREEPAAKRAKPNELTAVGFRFPLSDHLMNSQAQLFAQIEEKSQVASRSTDQLRSLHLMSQKKRDSVVQELQQHCTEIQSLILAIIRNETISLRQFLKNRYKLSFTCEMTVKFDDDEHADDNAVFVSV